MIRRVGYQGPSDLNLSTTSSSEHTQSFFVAQFSFFFIRRCAWPALSAFRTKFQFKYWFYQWVVKTHSGQERRQRGRRMGEMKKKKGYHFQIPFSFASRNVKHLISSLFFSHSSAISSRFGILVCSSASFLRERADSRDTRRYFKIMESCLTLSRAIVKGEKDASDFLSGTRASQKRREKGRRITHNSNLRELIRYVRRCINSINYV